MYLHLIAESTLPVYGKHQLQKNNGVAVTKTLKMVSILLTELVDFSE